MYPKKIQKILQNMDTRHTYPLLKIKSNLINKYYKLFKKDSQKTKSNDKIYICCIAKNEDEYFEEWIEYHLNLGFDKIIIFDNNDGFQLHTILEKYIKTKKIEIIDFKEKYPNNQFTAYNYFIKNFDFEYCAFIDLDEFIILNIHKNIKDFLKEYSNFDCIYINWMIYGTNGQKIKTEGLVQVRFKKPTLPLLNKENENVKSIVKNKEYLKFDISPHEPYLNHGSYTTTYKKCKRGPFHKPDYRIAYIKHFMTKSEEELIKKIKRGHPYYLVDGLKLDPYLKQTEDSYFTPLVEITTTKHDSLIKYLKENGIKEIHLNKLDSELILNLFLLHNTKIILHLTTLPNRDLFTFLLNYSFVNNNEFKFSFKKITEVKDKETVYCLKNL